MGGYQQILTVPNIPRGIFVAPNNDLFNLYWGDQNSIQFYQMDQNGMNAGGTFDRTPLLFVPSTDNVWTFQVMFDTTSSTNRLIAYAGQNLSFINNNVQTNVWYGDLYSSLPLSSIGQSIAGNIVVIHPYLFLLDNDGLVKWSDANKPNTFAGGTSGSARITALKLIAGAQTRGGSGAPAGLLWSLDSVIRVTFNVTANTFQFDTITDQSSILSSRSIIEYDSLYFWCGLDRFLVYNGAVQEVPNQLNLNFFFQNLNYAQRQKVWATKVPEFGEIWWWFPSGNATECNRAVIYNKRENTWYDTGILNSGVTGGRGAGYFDQVFGYPTWGDSISTNGTNYSIWMQEIGTDQNVNGVLTAIDSFFETGDIAFAAVGPTGSWTGIDRWVDLYRVELDFLQNGNMTMIINGREYARSNVQASVVYSFTPSTLKIDTREQRREMTIRFESNVIGGSYEMGQILVKFRTGDARP